MYVVHICMHTFTYALYDEYNAIFVSYIFELHLFRSYFVPYSMLPTTAPAAHHRCPSCSPPLPTTAAPAAQHHTSDGPLQPTTASAVQPPSLLPTPATLAATTTTTTTTTAAAAAAAHQRPCCPLNKWCLVEL